MNKICQKATLYESRETVHKMDGKDFKRYSWFVEHSDVDHDNSDQEDASNSQRVEEVNPRIGLKQTEERKRSPNLQQAKKPLSIKMPLRKKTLSDNNKKRRSFPLMKMTT